MAEISVGAKNLSPSLNIENYLETKNLSPDKMYENDNRAKNISPLRCTLNIMTIKFYLNIVNQMF
jgi:hypothetical protein